MATPVQVQCINKSDRANAHERIRSIGGPGWKMSQDQAITAIKNNTYAFWVSVSGSRVSVMVATSRYGYEYIKTEADGEQPNNLLSLPECP